MDDTSVEVCDYADGQEWQKTGSKKSKRKLILMEFSAKGRYVIRKIQVLMRYQR